MKNSSSSWPQSMHDVNTSPIFIPFIRLTTNYDLGIERRDLLIASFWGEILPNVYISSFLPTHVAHYKPVPGLYTDIAKAL